MPETLPNLYERGLGPLALVMVKGRRPGGVSSHDDAPKLGGAALLRLNSHGSRQAIVERLHTAHGTFNFPDRHWRRTILASNLASVRGPDASFSRTSEASSGRKGKRCVAAASLTQLFG